MPVSAPAKGGVLQLLHPLGKGGWGEVFLATEDGEKLAIKFLHPGLGSQALEFFKNEVRLLSRLSHPNLVKIFDFYSEAGLRRIAPPAKEKNLVSRLNALPCFTMEYLEGHTLEQCPRPVEISSILDGFIQVAQGLHYLHSRNILHRDLKPSNIHVLPSGQVKILDFNLSVLSDELGKKPSALGTLAFMAPEVFRGDYSIASDLFSWGVVFYQWASGKFPFAKPMNDAEALRTPPFPLHDLRPDLPDYFCRLIDRLLQTNPAARPSSALAVLKYLNQHLREPLPLLSETATETVLEKLPLVGREAVLGEILALRKSLAHLTGPMGVGRSRLLEELKWRFQLEGVPFLNLPKGAASPQPLKFLESLQSDNPGAAVLVFSDLQDWNDTGLGDLKILLHMASRRPLPWLILLESRETSENEPLKDLLQSLTATQRFRSFVLQDLSPADSLALMRLACPEGILKESRIRQRVEESGGRPLLLLEGLRQELLGTKELVGTNWQALTHARIEALTPAAQKLFALLLTHPAELSLREITGLAGNYLEDWEAALLELDEQALLAPRHPAKPQLKLAHPGLKKEFYLSLGEAIRHEAHQRWMHFLQGLRPEQPGEVAVLLAEHAWGDRSDAEIKSWGWAAAEFLSDSGRWLQALEWLERLLPLATDDETKVKVNARLATLYFRLGKFSESLQAYDRWIAHRQDDVSQLQQLKYLYYTGFVFFNWGRKSEAQERISQALEIGDGDKYPTHRPYLSRARATLAILLEKAGHLEAARGQLQEALPLAGDDQLLQGEVEQCWGNLEFKAMQFNSALEHFERARNSYHVLENRPSEAQALHSAGQVLLESGDLTRARAALRLSAEMALQAGDLLQWARFTENLAMLSIHQARYSEAKQGMEAAAEILAALAKPEDLRLIELHRAILHLYTGNWERVAQIFQNLETQAGEIHEDFKNLFELWCAEWSYLSGDTAGALLKFEKLASAFSGDFLSLPQIRARLGVLRCAVLLNSVHSRNDFVEQTLQALRKLPYPSFTGWRILLTGLFLPTEEWTEERLRSWSGELRASPFPEFRAEAYRLIATETQRRGLPSTAKYFAGEYLHELRNIYQKLAEEDQMDFEKNRDLKNLDRVLQETLAKDKEPVATSRAAPSSPPAPISHGTETQISESRFKQYTQINRYISQSRPLEDILERVMDAAIELTSAERGFLLLKDPKAKDGPLKGFEVKTARHLSQRSLAQKEFHFSLSAVKQVVEQGSYLLSDNAQMDERLQSQKSVVLYQLKSILACPLEAENQIVGAIYVDHPYRQACFSEENVVLLSALAGQAALAIQKAQLVEELRRSQEKLTAQVEDQAEKIEAMSEKLLQVRSSLRYGYEEIIGQSPTMMKVFELLDHVTETAIPVWICGESGTGKELIARSLHDNSPRKKASFVAENCSAIPETLLESELFGHKRGAFTHADRDRVGLLEQASGGTLFLDEVADMSMAMQAKLLRVLQEGEVRPLGSNRIVKVDVRLVTASNRDLKALVQEGKFRQDLFFRINGLTVRLPSLRERKEDILLLAQHFIKKFSRDLNLKSSELSDAALQLLLRHPWPGNIRELEGVIRTALLFAKGRTIQPEHLQLDLAPFGPVTSGPSATGSRRSSQEEESEERQMILETLKQCKLDKEAAAKKLGMGLRTLYTRMGILGLPKKKTLLAKYLGLG